MPDEYPVRTVREVLADVQRKARHAHQYSGGGIKDLASAVYDLVHRWPICEIARQTGLPQQLLYADQNARPRKYMVDAELDEIAVERFMGGTLRLPGKARSAERVEAIRRLASRGMSDTEIADRVGLDFQAVLKQRVRNSIPAGVERPARRLAERTA